MEKFKVIKRIGKGSFSLVYKAELVETRRIVAIKKYKNITDPGDGVNETVIRELAILKFVNHPNIINMIGYDNIDFDVVGMEYYPTDLKHYIFDNSDTFDNEDICDLSHQLINGIYYLHSLGIMHRDIKPQNIMIGHNQRLIIIDIGLGKRVDIGFTDGDKTPEVSTLWYRSPEILLGASSYHFPMDMWSVGCVIGEMVLKRAILAGDSEVDQLFKIFKMFGTPRNDIWEGVENLANYKKVFPRLKSTFDKIFTDNNELKYIISKLLTLNPTERWTSGETLRYISVSKTPINDHGDKYYTNISKMILPRICNSLQNQSIVTSFYRVTLLNWLLEVCQEYDISLKTFVRAQGIIDRYSLINTDIKSDQYQLIGVSSLWIAQKLEDVTLVSSLDLVYISKNCYTVNELIKMEKKILKDLDLDVYFPTTLDFVSKNMFLSPYKELEIEFLLVYLTFNITLTSVNPLELYEIVYDYIVQGVQDERLNKWIKNGIKNNLGKCNYIQKYFKILKYDSSKY